MINETVILIYSKILKAVGTYQTFQSVFKCLVKKQLLIKVALLERALTLSNIHFVHGFASAGFFPC